ncbi:M16 family metallopeptidase [Fodinibius sp. AD559]|uniref:M16 family metallopeptidase n=1 Tax=Fodinibius sp. AD559 TaxID=3424179 RepID=UPI004046FD65
MKRLSLFLLMAVFAFACSQTEQMADSQQSDNTSTNPYENMDFPELNDFQKPKVETFTTENGITFYLVEDKELPLINVSTRIRTGGVLNPNKKTGLASITGTVMRSGGTETYPADSLNTMLENRAASIETGIGFTSGNASMDVLKEDFDDLLPVFIDVLTNPKFPEDKIELAKKQQKSSISRRNDNTQQIGIREFQALIYGENSPYGRTTEYETINNISREDLVNFHDKHFSASNMMVGIVGDFDAEEMKKKLRNSFGELPSGDETTLKFPEVDYEPQSSINFIEKSDVNQSFAMMGHIGGMRDNPDYAKVQVMNRVLSGGFSGRLMQIVRTEMGLAYSVSGQYGMNSFYPGMFFAGVMTKSSTTAEAIDAIIEQIERLQEEPITKQELQDVKDQILNSAVFEYDSYEEVLRERMSNEYRGLPADAFEQYIEGVKATTIEDVQAVAQEYLNPDNLQILVVGNKEEIGDQLEKYGDVNEIDISIPEPGSGEEQMVEGDAEKGNEWLSKMTDSVIKSGTKLNSISLTGEMNMQGRKMPMTTTINYPDAINQTIKGPMGEIKVNYEGGSGTMTVGEQERPLPPQMAKNLKSTLNRSFLSIALNADSVNPQYLGTEEVDGMSYEKINVTVDGSNVKLLLDPETHYPDIIRYKQFNPQMGEQVTVENHNSDWKIVDSVAYPYLQETMINGNKSGEAVYKSHKVNK